MTILGACLPLFLSGQLTLCACVCVCICIVFVFLMLPVLMIGYFVVPISHFRYTLYYHYHSTEETYQHKSEFYSLGFSFHDNPKLFRHPIRSLLLAFLSLKFIVKFLIDIPLFQQVETGYLENRRKCQLFSVSP